MSHLLSVFKAVGLTGDLASTKIGPVSGAEWVNISWGVSPLLARDARTNCALWSGSSAGPSLQLWPEPFIISPSWTLLFILVYWVALSHLHINCHFSVYVCVFRFFLLYLVLLHTFFFCMLKNVMYVMSCTCLLVEGCSSSELIESKVWVNLS